MGTEGRGSEDDILVRVAVLQHALRSGDGNAALERDLAGGLLLGVAGGDLLLALELPLLYPWIFLRRKNSTRSCSSSSPRM